MTETQLTFNKASTFANLNQAIPGTTSSLASLQPTVQQIINANPLQYQSTPAGRQSLQLRAQGQYSNKQLITPVKYSLNVEGSFITVDYLGKRIITDNNMPFRAIASLSAATIDIKIINNSRDLGENRSINASPSVQAARQIFDTGSAALGKNLSNRFTQYISDVANNGSQVFGSLQTIGQNALQSIPTASKFTQSLSNIPGVSVATDALGQIPSPLSRLPSLTNALSNPLGAVQSVVGTAAQGLNLQAALPSVDLGSLTSVFSTATDVFHNGPPTSLQGAIALEKQVKAIICNFQLPKITMPSWDSLTEIEFPSLEDIAKQVKKELEDTLSNIQQQLGSITEQLKEMIPDPEEIYKEIVKELTTCDKNPNAETNSKSGKSSN
jgi:hypothetical protein